MNAARTLLPVVAFVVLARPLAAADGLLIVQQTTSSRGTETTQVQIEAQRMRAEVADPGGAKQTVIFDGGKQILYVIDASKKTYMEITKADVDRMGAQMAQMSAQLAQMQDALKNLPPAQRAQVEAMMAGRGGSPGGPGAAPARTQYRKTGSGKVGKWACDTYDGFQGAQKTEEVCTVAPTALGFAAADFEVTRQMADFFRGLMPQSADTLFQVGRPEQQGFSGLPVRSVHNPGPSQTVTEMVDVKRQPFDDALFAVPAGFTKSAAFGAVPGRGRGQ
jgi:hypothetical protein